MTSCMLNEISVWLRPQFDQNTTTLRLLHNVSLLIGNCILFSHTFFQLVYFVFINFKCPRSGGVRSVWTTLFTVQTRSNSFLAPLYLTCYTQVCSRTKMWLPSFCDRFKTPPSSSSPTHLLPVITILPLFLALRPQWRSCPWRSKELSSLKYSGF